MEAPFLQLNLSSVEHVWVEYHVAESIVFGKTLFFVDNLPMRNRGQIVMNKIVMSCLDIP
jgi:hypothetical protein